MGWSMPHSMQKGPVWTFLEQFYNTEPDATQPALLSELDAFKDHHPGELVIRKRLAILNRMAVRKTPFGDNSVFKTKVQSDQFIPEEGPTVVEHICKHWLGYEDTTLTNRVRHPTGGYTGEFVMTDPNGLGPGVGYFGDVEQIVHRTLMIALRQSLGLSEADFDDSGYDQQDWTPSPALLKKVRHLWPIDFQHSCMSHWFEGWVFWRRQSQKTDYHSGGTGPFCGRTEVFDDRLKSGSGGSWMINGWKVSDEFLEALDVTLELEGARKGDPGQVTVLFQAPMNRTDGQMLASSETITWDSANGNVEQNPEMDFYTGGPVEPRKRQGMFLIGHKAYEKSFADARTATPWAVDNQRLVLYRPALLGTDDGTLTNYSPVVVSNVAYAFGGTFFTDPEVV